LSTGSGHWVGIRQTSRGSRARCDHRPDADAGNYRAESSVAPPWESEPNQPQKPSEIKLLATDARK